MVCRIGVRPTVTFEVCRLFGGSRPEGADSVALAPDGDVFVSGFTWSEDFATSEGAFQSTFPGSLISPFLARFPEDLSEPLAATFLGGSGLGDSSLSLAVGPSGALFGAGITFDADFPVTPDAFQAERAGNHEAIVVELDPDLTTLRYSSYFGGAAADTARGLAIASDGSVLVAGGSLFLPSATPGPDEPSFPTTGGTFGGSGEDGFLIKFEGSSLSGAAIVGSADFVGGALTPIRITSVFVAGFGPAAVEVFQLDSEGKLPREIGGTRVLVNGDPSPMIFSVDGQLSFIPDLPPGAESASIQVEFNGGRSNTVTLPVRPSQPGIFTLAQSGMGQAALLNQDFTVNRPGNGASRGTGIQVFLTGAGLYDAPCPADSLAPSVAPLPRIRGEVRVLINGEDAQVLYAGVAPGLVCSLAQVNALVGENVAPGDAVALQVMVDGVASIEGVTFVVAP